MLPKLVYHSANSDLAFSQRKAIELGSEPLRTMAPFSNFSLFFQIFPYSNNITLILNRGQIT